MNVAYVTTYDSADRNAWSGLGFHIGRCLELAGFGLIRIGPLARRSQLAARLRQLEAMVQRRSYPLDRDPRVARAYAADVARQLGSTPRDLVFSPGTIPIAYLETSDPVAFWADATFAAMLRSYPEYRSFSRRAIRIGAALEARALERATAAFYASEWAARSAVEDHGADPARVEVLPFGANMPISHGRQSVIEIVRARPADRCRLLFVGVDWSRKGGPLALEAARILNERGLPTELDIVGADPPAETSLPVWVRSHGFVDKATDVGSGLMRRLFSDAHILIHPASAEAFGVVFSEAAAHGVLSVAARVGGIPTAVREGITGVLCESEAPAEVYADEVLRLMEDGRRYEALAVGAFDEYERTLSWDAQAARLRSLLPTSR